MGYLQLPSGIPNFSKAVMSLWFRFPTASFAAAQAQWVAAGVDAFHEAVHADPDAIIATFDNNLLGIIPLVTWGPNPIAESAQYGSTKISPCFIGLNCGAAFIDPPSVLPTTPIVAMGFSYSGQDTEIIAGTTVPNNFQIGRFLSDAAFWEGTPANSIPDDSVLMHAAPEAWHHLLVSFDLDHAIPNLLADKCKLWVALDDVNRNGLAFFPAYAGPPGASGDANSIAQNSRGYGQANGALQASGHPFGIPCTSENVARVYQVEMAEFQLYTGVTLDTSDVVNRRAFVTADGKPEPSATAQALLGKAPDILLHGSTNWINGRNTGSTGPLSPAGSIDPYTPGPDLTP